jgi:hypothetical protein
MENETLEKEAGRIADAITELVNRIQGPVMLTQVDREVPGFAGHAPPYWDHLSRGRRHERSFWYGMTEAGHTALLKVMNERRVAIQFVSPLLYLALENLLIEDMNWQPIVLLPARAANVESPNWSMRLPARVAKGVARQGRNRLLKPGVVRATADVFFGVNADGLA